MLNLVVDYTELGCCKLKNGKGFLKPNFELVPKPELLWCRVRRVKRDILANRKTRQTQLASNI